MTEQTELPQRVAVYENPWFSILKEGKYHFMDERSPNSGAVILLKEGDDFVFIRSHRPAQGGEVVEAVRGYGEVGEGNDIAALRELAEEVGYHLQPEDLVRLGRTCPNTAVMTTVTTVYFADVTGRAQQEVHDEEVLGVVRIPADLLSEAVASGRLVCGYTLAALGLYWARFGMQARGPLQ